MDKQRIAIFKKPLALFLAFALMLGTLPGMTAYAEGAGQSCSHEHDAGCSYMEAAPCEHAHDETCGYAEGSEGASCTFEHEHDGACGYDGENADTCDYDPASHVHDDACGYAEPVPAAPCGHNHDENCGYIEAVPCGHVCDEACGGLTLGRSVDSATPTDAAVVTAFDALQEHVAVQAVPLATSMSALALPDTLEAEVEADGAARTVPVAVWQSSPEYDGDAEGVYIFTPELSGGYTVARGVVLPVISVTVEAATADAPGVTFEFDPDGPLYLTEGMAVTDADLLAGVTAADENGAPLTVTVAGIDGLDMADPQMRGAYPNPPYEITYEAVHPVTGESFTAARKAYVTAGVGSIQPLAAGDVITVGILKYNVLTETPTGGTVAVGDNRTLATANLVIPETIDYGGKTYDVVAIADNAFAGTIGTENTSYLINYKLSGTLTLPGSLHSIGANAFSGCIELTGALDIPDGVTSIGDYAFYFCDHFTGSLTLPSNLVSIGDSAFSACPFTGALTLPNSLVSVGDNAFYGCSFTGSLTFPDSLAIIGDYAFGGNIDPITFDRATPPAMGRFIFHSVPTVIVTDGTLTEYIAALSGKLGYGAIQTVSGETPAAGGITQFTADDLVYQITDSANKRVAVVGHKDGTASFRGERHAGAGIIAQLQREEQPQRRAACYSLQQLAGFPGMQSGILPR